FGVLLATEGWASVRGVYFSDPMMIFDMIRFAGSWPWLLLLPLGFGLVGIGMLLVRLTGDPLRPRQSALTITALVLALVALDWGIAKFTATNLLSSGISTVMRPVINAWVNQKSGAWVVPDTLASDSFALDYPANRTPPLRILSVAIESLGVELDAKHQAELIASLTGALRGRYVVTEIGRHRYHGSTLEGEIRELCALRLNTLPRSAAEDAILMQCLPARLSRQGWDTSGWHGNAGQFYRRNEIYPTMGLGIINDFRSLIAKVSAPCMFLFVGICDRDIFRLSLDWLGNRDRGFAHVMSLDTHLPLPANSYCGGNQICLYRYYQSRTLGALAEELARRPSGPDIVYVYGDHAPKFLDAKIRGQFVPDVVPFVVIHRANAAKNGPRIDN
ncbi:MAG: hypothetical protein ACOYKQ_02555, partial [Polymorphobacter sp.]